MNQRVFQNSFFIGRIRAIICICCLFSLKGFSQTSGNTPKINMAVETYSYLKGQNAALQRISMQFPSLKDNVEALQKNSVMLFSRAEKNIEHILEKELEKSEYNRLKNQIRSFLSKFKDPIQKKKHAEDFLDKVKERSLVKDDSQISKALLSFAYHDKPHQEITDGHLKTFTTKGHPKAVKSTVTIPIPKSWKAEDAEMPETIQQFTSFNGNGSEKILIVIYEPDHGFVLNESVVPQMLDPQTDLIRTETITIDGKQGIMAECEQILDPPKNKIKIRMLQFMVAAEKKLYCFQGSIGPAASSENLEIQLKKFEPLFRLIVSKAQIEN